MLRSPALAPRAGVQAAPAPASVVAARLASPAVLRGSFEQEKRLAGFRNPLLSKGDFLMAKDRGVVWATRAPSPPRWC
jgi:hypothetical protein